MEINGFTLTLKKIIISGFLLSCIFSYSFAQRDEGASLGIRAGMNYSFLDFILADEELLPGISLGLFSKAPVDGKFYLQPEISGSMQNIRATVNIDEDHFKYKLSFIYAESTFLGVYNFTERVAIHAGPFISYLVHLELKKESSFTDEYNFFARSDFFDVNTGLIYGAALEFKWFDVGMRFNHGLFVTGKHVETSPRPDLLQTRNSFLQLYGTVLF